jgi:hypothetical protein
MAHPEPALQLTSGQQVALAYLLEAFQIARETDLSPFAYACQLQCLQGAGITETVLRWLVQHGFAHHLLETTRPTRQRRTFRASPNLRLTSDSCFVLTLAGIAQAAAMQAAAMLAESLGPRDEPRLDSAHAKPGGRCPHYDAGSRTLLIRGQVVKQFKKPADNQELILISYEEERWPLYIPDPLPVRPGVDRKRRLNETIKNLNTRQVHPLVRFHGDGTGTGIVWKTRT